MCECADCKCANRTIMLIEVIKGDITKVAVDAIVNAANSSLLGGGGVDGAIHRAGGPEILEECRKIVARQGPCKTGEAVITTAGNLPAKYVIHTVGPVWNERQAEKQDKQLANCYTNSLQLAVEHDCNTIAFPGISTGVYRFPKERAAKIAVNAVKGFLQQTSKIDKVVFVCFDDENFELIKREAQQA
jgi:O-acetyl-ADP-ribose deacetylase (regulator of RNase III)